MFFEKWPSVPDANTCNNMLRLKINTHIAYDYTEMIIITVVKELPVKLLGNFHQ